MNESEKATQPWNHAFFRDEGSPPAGAAGRPAAPGSRAFVHARSAAGKDRPRLRVIVGCRPWRLANEVPEDPANEGNYRRRV